MLESHTTAPTGETTAPEAATTAVPIGGTVTALFSGILDDAQKLARQQFDMFKAELHEDFRQSKRAAEFGGLGIVLLAVGLLGLMTTFAFFLNEYFHFTLWISWLITSGIFITGGVGLALIGYLILERFNPLPRKSLHALHENLTWKTT